LTGREPKKSSRATNSAEKKKRRRGERLTQRKRVSFSLPVKGEKRGWGEESEKSPGDRRRKHTILNENEGGGGGSEKKNKRKLEKGKPKGGNYVGPHLGRMQMEDKVQLRKRKGKHQKPAARPGKMEGVVKRDTKEIFDSGRVQFALLVLDCWEVRKR